MPIALLGELLRSIGPAGVASCTVALAGSIHLVERRGRTEKLDPKRQVDIATLLESIPEVAVIVDAAGVIVEANSEAAQLLSISREEMRGARVREISRLLENKDENTAVPEPMLERALKGQVVRHERRILRNAQTGAAIEVLVSANPIRKDGGEIIGALVIGRDITELTQLQRRVGDIERHRAIGQMAAALAHDFNNILQTIGQAAALLQMDAERPPAERKPLLDIIQNTVRRGAEIIARVREYLRTGSGELSPVDIREVMRETIELTKPLWQKTGITLVARLEPVPQARTNAADLRRVFTNLIINAIEAMPNGGQLSLACEPREDMVLVTVSDTGVGIPRDQQKKIFFPYFTTKEKGTGLGLSGAQKILLSQGGNISVASEPGKGTTFSVLLPAVNEYHNHSAA